MTPYENILHKCCSDEAKNIYSTLSCESKKMMIEAIKSTVESINNHGLWLLQNYGNLYLEEKEESKLKHQEEYPLYEEKMIAIKEAILVSVGQCFIVDFIELLKELEFWGQSIPRSEALLKHYQKISKSKSNEQTQRPSRLSSYHRVIKGYESNTAFSKLQKIYVRDLKLFSTAKGKYLEGHLITDPFVMTGITTYLEDDKGDFVQLALYNMYSSETNKVQIAKLEFPRGLTLKISEPFYKIFRDGTRGIRIDSPNELHLGENIVKSQIKSMNEIQAEGKELFKKGELLTALKLYFKGIANYTDTVSVILNNRAQAELKLGENEEALLDSAAVLIFQDNQKAKLRYKTAALKLGLVTDNINIPSINKVWEKALENLVAPLKLNFESTRENGNKYYRKGNYNQAKLHYTASLNDTQVCVLLNNIALVCIKLKIFQTGIAAAAACLRITTNEKITSKARYLMAKAFSLLGQFHFSKLAASGELSCRTVWENVEDAKTHAVKFAQNYFVYGKSFSEILNEFAGVEICGDYVNSQLLEHRYIEGKGRGLIALRNIKPGELILVDHPISIGDFTVNGKNEQIHSQSIQLTTMHAKNRSVKKKSHYQLLSKILQLISLDGILARKLSLLEYRGKINPSDEKIPLIDLKEMEYQRLSYEVLPFMSQNPSIIGFNTEKLSKSFIENILEINAFDWGDFTECKWLRGSALFLRISLFNHSAVPNCDTLTIGDAMAVFCATDIEKGEELTLHYLAGCDKSQKNSFAKWGF